jgi:ABC-type phosphate transport system permease subunit
MTLMDALILLGLILIIFGCIFYIIATIMERHYDQKLWELDNKLKQDEKWRKEYRKMIELSASLGVLIILISIVYMGLFL